MGRYAEKTTASSEKSRSEIEATLRRYGATAFAYGWEGTRASVQFQAKGRRIRFILPMPDPQDRFYTHTPTTQVPRSLEQQARIYEQAIRQRWRALALVIKAKLEAVDAGITEFEDEFLANIVLPNGQNVGSWMRPQVAIAYERSAGLAYAAALRAHIAEIAGGRDG